MTLFFVIQLLKIYYVLYYKNFKHFYKYEEIDVYFESNLRYAIFFFEKDLAGYNFTWDRYYLNKYNTVFSINKDYIQTRIKLVENAYNTQKSLNFECKKFILTTFLLGCSLKLLSHLSTKIAELSL